MRSSFYLWFVVVAIAALFAACKDDGEVDPDEQECFRCIYDSQVQMICNSELTFEICVIGPHQSSLQSIMEIKEICDGQVTDFMEKIGFVEDVLELHQSGGAECESF